MKTRTTCISLILLLVIVGTSMAAAPPLLINYQGVLRNNLDAPLTGSKDMVFRFYSVASGGSPLLTDSHTAAGVNAVTVSAGLFNTQLGGGTISAGTSASLGDLVRDNTTVYLEVQVGAEILLPRIRIVSAAYSLNATTADTLDGRDSSAFLDTSSTAQTKLGSAAFNASFTPSTYGIESFGVYPKAAGHFKDTSYSGESFLAGGDTGIAGFGTYAGGIFRNGNPTSYTDEAYLAYGDIGVQGFGDTAGGFFQARSDAGTRVGIATVNGLGTGQKVGVEAYGTDIGGFFKDSNQSGQAYVGYFDRGIDAKGNEAGGYFSAGLASEGLYAFLAHRESLNVGTGVEGHGKKMGGYFEDSNDASKAELASGGWGIVGLGYGAAFGGGGDFADLSGGATSIVAQGIYKIVGSGTVSFVQNHPQEKDKVIVYAAPEGDEVAVYTRGSARLVNGEARVPLGETFAWVTNPDIGLTAQVTPRTNCKGLYVESASPDQLVVREIDGGKSDAVFDYTVWGLRIGFEESSIVQDKRREARIPSMAGERERYEREPELRAFNALERFRAMRRASGFTEVLDLSRARTLHDAIEEFDPANPAHLAALASSNSTAPTRPSDLPAPTAAALAGNEARRIGSESPAPEAPGGASDRIAPNGTASLTDRDDLVRETSVLRVPSGVTQANLFPASTVAVPTMGPVEAGDVLANQPSNPGTLRAAASASDRGVVGIVAGEPGTLWTGVTAPLALAGTVVWCKADASYGPIEANDLLVASQTPGHAMRSQEAMPGTVVGKALEPLESGTGLIKVLVMAR